MTKGAASILAANPLEVGRSIEAMEQAGVDIFHLDIMDGVFVPNISFGADMVRAVRKATRLPLDVHLMIVEPERYVEEFIEAGADNLTFHVEASEKVEETLKKIRRLGARPGLSYRPQTELSALGPYLPLVDIVLVMTVNPGFGGQKLIPEAAARIPQLRTMLDAAHPGAEIAVDGGLHMENAAEIAGLGADILVMGTGLIRAERPAEMLATMHAL